LLSTLDILLFSLFGGDERETVLFGIFLAVIVIFMILDLGLFHKQAHKISTKSALNQSIFWVSVSSVFGCLIYFGGPYEHLEAGAVVVLSGSEAAVLYLTTYLTEYALSVDNIFVILLILKYFKVAILIQQFHWILYIFGVFLIYSGIRIYFEDGDEKIEPEKNPILKLCRRYLPITANDRGGMFFVKEGGKFFFTPLFLVIILIETTDLIFAVDSIPAAFAITQNEFLIYTSNIFAVMGLRAMFFLLAGIIDKFYLLQKGLSIILFFIGAKMLLEIFDVDINVYLSFTVIIATLFLSIIFSVLVPRKAKPELE